MISNHCFRYFSVVQHLCNIDTLDDPDRPSIYDEVTERQTRANLSDSRTTGQLSRGGDHGVVMVLV